jgi:crotonobetainyl-CoA:carnitine CoA-transferase CaiB-like acyl-CoA transferase
MTAGSRSRSWIAIAVFDDTHWTSLASVLGDPLLADDDRFATMAARVQNEDVLEALIGELTKDWDGFELMNELQALGVTAGVCQTAEDRCETDPQLRHLNWLVERDQTSIGRWPVRELPTKFSGTPADMGGILGRSGPDYGEDTDYVLRSILGLTADEVTELREQGAV